MTQSPRSIVILITVLLAMLLSLPLNVSGADKILIARDGAGHDFIENTLAALPLAVADKVDFIELRTVLTRDDKLIVYNDLTLNRLTDVAVRFPERHRDDGNFYVIDFDLSEIRQLRLHNIFDTGSKALSLPIPTLNEELAVINHLDKMFNQVTGLTIEPGYPKFHTEQSKDISDALLTEIVASGVLQENRPVYLQSSDADELQRLHDSLLTARNIGIPLIQLVRFPADDSANSYDQGDYSWIFTNSGLRLIGLYASCLGIPGQAIVNNDGTMPLTGFLQEARAKGLKILATSLPAADGTTDNGQPPLAMKLDQLFQQAEVDGLYSDNFQAVQKYLQDKADEVRRQNDLPPFFSSLQLARPKHDEPANSGSAIQDQPQQETFQQLKEVGSN